MDRQSLIRTAQIILITWFLIILVSVLVYLFVSPNIQRWIYFASGTLGITVSVVAGVAQIAAILKPQEPVVIQPAITPQPTNTTPTVDIHPGSNRATYAKTSHEVPEQPEEFIGREPLRAEINDLLDKGEKVLLHGFGGMGKTALAATIAAARLTDGGAVLWQKMGSEETNVIFEALAHPFDRQKEMAATLDDQKGHLAQQIVAQEGVSLLVLDDAWNGTTLESVLKSAPPKLPVIITSRTRFPGGKIVSVGELKPDEALQALRRYAKNTNTSDEESANALCKHLGYHAFALEIAGKTLLADDITPAQLLEQVKDAPHDLKVPEEFSEAGRRSVADLIWASLSRLEPETQRAFLRMGAFFAPQMTAEMLAMFDDEEPEAMREALQTLTRRGLAEKIAADERTIEHFRLHDLAYSYARAQNADAERRKALDACMNYVYRYNEPSLKNFATLRPEIDNFLGAAVWALGVGQYTRVDELAENLYASGSRILDYLGLHVQAISLLSNAVEANRQNGDRPGEAIWLNNLGSAYLNLDQYQRAIEYYEQALIIDQEIENQGGEAIRLLNLGNAYLGLDQYQRAIEYHERALVINRKMGNRYREGQSLGNLAIIYLELTQYRKAIEFNEQALIIDREVGYRRGEGIRLGNLGEAYNRLRQYEIAIKYHEDALAISRQIGDRHGEGHRLGNLGATHANLGQYDTAIEYFEQAIVIWAEMDLPHMIQLNEENIAKAQRLRNQQIQ